MQIKLLIITSVVLLCNTVSSSLISNSNFEKFKIWKQLNIPADWSGGMYNNPKAVIGFDDKIVYSGKKSLKLQGNIKKGRIVVRSGLSVIPEGKKNVYISIYTRYELKGEGKLVLIAYNEKGKQTLWKGVFFIRGKSDWRELSRKISIPSGTKKIKISLRLNGIGVIWYDDLQVTFNPLPLKHSKKKIIDTSRWTDYVPSGAENTFAIDKGKNGQVELRWKDGLANFGICSNLLSVKPKQTYAFSVSVKSSKQGASQLMARAFDINDNLLMEEKTREVSSPNRWITLSKKFKIPGATAKIQLFCLNKGEGSVWFKEINLSKVSSAGFKSQFPVAYGCEPAKGNELWNNGRAVFNSIVDSPSSLVFDFWGDKSRLKNPSFVIELQAGAAIEQCFNSHANVKNPLVKPEIVNFVKGGKKWRRYIYRNIWCIANMKPKPGFCRSLSFLFRPDSAATSLNKNYSAFSYVINNAKKSPAKEFYVNFIPSMKKTQNPKEYSVFLWSNWDTAVTGDKLFKSVLRKYEEAGMISRCNNTWGREQVFKQDQTCAGRGWKMFTAMGRNLFGTPFVSKLGKKSKSVTWRNKTNHHTCPSLLISERGREILKQAIFDIGSKTKLKKGNWVLFDYEPWQSQDWCFCSKCMKRFAAFSGKKSSVNEIRKKLWKEWTAFRVADSNAILGYAVKTTRELFPGVKVADYDYPIDFRQQDLTRRLWKIPKDTRLSDKYLDAHYLSYYYYHGKRGFEFLDINAEKLKKPFVMFSLLARYSDPKQSTYARSINETMSPYQFRQAMLNGASAGSIGHAIFPGVKIDGKYFPAIDTAMEEIAKLEEIYKKGKRLDSSVEILANWEVSTKKDKVDDYVAWRVHQLDQQYSVTLFNFSRNKKVKCNIKFKLKAGKWQLVDVSSGKIINSPTSNIWTAAELQNGISSVIPPFGVRLLKLTRK